MAPTNPHAAKNNDATLKKRREVQDIVASLRLTLASTKAKLSTLRSRGPFRITKSHTFPNDSKPRIEALRRSLRDLPSDQNHINSPSEPHTKPQDDVPPPPPSPSLHISLFEIGGPLGRGKFGQVYLAKHRITSYICALKMISKAQVTSSAEEKLIRRELEVHQNLAHPNILKLLNWFHDEKNIYLVLEYAPSGSLYERLTRQGNGRFREDVAARYIAQMAQALKYMHGKQIIHRDIKPENILLGLHNEIKLADFGWSVHSSSGLRQTVCGTLDYLSPEVALMLLKPDQPKSFYTKAIDQWSLGVLAYELVVGKPPFEMKSEEATKKKIAGFNGRVSFPGHVSKGARGFILQLLSLDAEKRMSLDSVLAHPWIARHVEKSVQARFSKLL